MTGILLVAQFILAVILTITVLLQKSSSIGLGAYSGSNESLFGAKGPAGFLAKFTFSMGLIFVINTLALGYFYNTEKSGSIAEQIETSIPLSGESKLPQAPEAPKAD